MGRAEDLALRDQAAEELALLGKLTCPQCGWSGTLKVALKDGVPVCPRCGFTESGTWETEVQQFPVGTRVRITDGWPAHEGEEGVVVHDDGGLFSVYIRLDNGGKTLSAWLNGTDDKSGNRVLYSVSASRTSLQVID